MIDFRRNALRGWAIVLLFIGCGRIGYDPRQLEAEAIPAEASAPIPIDSGRLIPVPDAGRLGAPPALRAVARPAPPADAGTLPPAEAGRGPEGGLDAGREPFPEPPGTVAGCLPALAAGWTFAASVEGWTMSGLGELAWLPGLLGIDSANGVRIQVATPFDSMGKTFYAAFWTNQRGVTIAPWAESFVGGVGGTASGAPVALATRVWTCITFNVLAPASQTSGFAAYHLIYVGYDVAPEEPYELYMDRVGY